MPEKNSRLRIIAGPNGSGKSTVIERIRLDYNCGPFVNADVIETLLRTNNILYLAQYNGLSVPADSWNVFMKGPGSSWVEKAANEGAGINVRYGEDTFTIEQDSVPGRYDAAIVADFIRYSLLAQDSTFTFETVLSDARKLQFLEQAVAAGYKPYLYFVCTVDPAINIARVAQRVMKGGHDVPAGKITDRYWRSLGLLHRLVPLMHRTYLFDNSSQDSETKLIAEIDRKGSLVIYEDRVPWWMTEYVIDPLYISEEEE